MANNLAEIHKDNILCCGTKFTISEDSTDGVVGPGSTGVISYVMGSDYDYKNVVFLNVVINRRGKGGKDRLEEKIISTPIYDFQNEYYKSFLPDEKRKQYVHILTESHNDVNVLEMPDLDFLSWAYAKVLFCAKLSQTGRYLTAWPKNGDNILNVMRDMGEIFGADYKSAIKDFCSKKQRILFIMALRKIEASLSMAYELYTERIHKIRGVAIEFLLSNWKNKVTPCTMKSLTNTRDYLAESSKNLTKTIEIGI